MVARSLEDLFSLKGRRAIVTGASSGLGIEFARALALAGADVALVARRIERLRSVGTELEDFGVRCAVIPADLEKDEEITGAAAAAEEALGPIDVLVNNAGISTIGRAEKLSREKWDLSIQLNLTAAFRLSQEVAKRMIERGTGGRIINITSVLSNGANPVYWSAGYVASKAALGNLTRQLATEWAKHQITVNAIGPAFFPTEMTEVGLTKESNKAKIESFTPMGRLGHPAELQTALLFLAAPASSYVTGTTIFVDGGWTAW
jgi:NAD(P)-dependent dehydrogenase (short-subunit alcohol dehydrogenase family)